MASPLSVLYDAEMVDALTVYARHVRGNVTQLTERSNLHETRIQTAETYQTTNDARVTNVEDDVDALDTRLTTAEADIDTLEGEVDDLQAGALFLPEVATVSTLINFNESYTNAISAKKVIHLNAAGVEQVVTLATDLASSKDRKAWVFRCANGHGAEIQGSFDPDTNQHIHLLDGEFVEVQFLDAENRWAVLRRGRTYDRIPGFVTKSSTGNIGTYERCVIADTSAGAITLTLPDPGVSGLDPGIGAEYIVVNHRDGFGAANVTVDVPAGSILSDGNTSVALAPGKAMSFMLLPEVAIDNTTDRFVWLMRGVIS